MTRPADHDRVKLPFADGATLTIVEPLTPCERGELRAELDQLSEDYEGPVFSAMSSLEDEKTRATLRRIREIKRMLGD